MDMKALLVRYMQIIIHAEGVTYFEHEELTSQERAALREIEDEAIKDPETKRAHIDQRPSYER